MTHAYFGRITKLQRRSNGTFRIDLADGSIFSTPEAFSVNKRLSEEGYVNRWVKLTVEDDSSMVIDVSAVTEATLGAQFDAALAAAGLPQNSSLDDLIQHHRAQAATAATFDRIAKSEDQP